MELFLKRIHLLQEDWVIDVMGPLEKKSSHYCNVKDAELCFKRRKMRMFFCVFLQARNAEKAM